MSGEVKVYEYEGIIVREIGTDKLYILCNDSKVISFNDVLTLGIPGSSIRITITVGG